MLVRFCGADCSTCETYLRSSVGEETGVVNSETGFRCCWLPEDYPRGVECPIKVCCLERGVRFCGECSLFGECERMEVFYSQPDYERLRERMLKELAEKGDVG